MASSEGSATFRAIADFSRLRRESKKASRELDGMRDSARNADRALEDTETESREAAKALTDTQKGMRRASEALEAARRREADAAGRVRVAEEQLAKVRKEGGDTTARLVATQEQLAKSQRDLYTAQQRTVRVAGDLNTAHERVAVATERVEKAQTRLRTETDRSTGVFGKLRMAFRAAADEQSRFGRSVTNMGRRLPGVIGLLTKLTAVLGAVALASGALHAGAAGVMSLVGALGALSGVVGVLPAALGLLAAGVATVIIGFKGFGDAMSAVAEGDAAKFEEALKNLTPAAQGVARALWDMRPAFKAIKDTVQERLFAGMGDEVRDLGGKYLPMLKRTLGDVAGALNATVKGITEFYKSARAVEGTRRIFDRISTAFALMAPAGRNVAEALFDITDVGSEFLAPMAEGITDATERFKVFIAQAKESGKLKDWIGTGIQATKRLGSTIGNLGSTIMGVFRAANSVGRDFLQTLDEGTERMAQWVNSAKGQNALASFFESASRAAAVLWPIVGALAEVIGTQLAPLLARIAEKIGPGVESVIRGLGDAFEAAGPGLERFFTAVGDLLEALGDAGPLVGELAGGLADVLAPAVHALADGLEALTAWFNSLPEPMQSVIGKIGGVALAAGGMLFVLGKIVKMGKGVVGTLASLRAALGAIGLIPMPDIDTKGAEKKGRRAGKSAQRGITGGLSKGFKGKIGGIATTALSIIPRLGVWGLIAGAVIGVGYLVYDNWDSIKAWTADAWGAVSTWTADAWGAVSTWVSTKATEAKDAAVGAFTTAKDWVVGKSTEAKDGVVGAFTQARDWVAMRATETKDAAVGQFETARAWVTQKATAARDGAVGAFTQARDWVGARATEARDRASAAYDTAKTWVTDKAHAAAQGVQNGYARARDWVGARANEARDRAAGAYETAKNWVRDKANAAADAAGRAFGRARDAVSNAAGGARNAAGSAYERLRDRVVSAVTSARDRASAAFNQLKSAASSAYSWVSSKVSSISSRIGSLASRAWGGVTSWFSSGGWVGGTGNRDSVHGMLTPDEFVVRQKRAEQFAPLLEAINSNASPGKVARLAASTAGADVASGLLSRAAGFSAVAPQVAAPRVPAVSFSGVTGGGTQMQVEVTQNVYNPRPETPSESLTRRMRRASELGLREVLDGRRG